MHSHNREPFVIGVDSGGTHTRVGCFSLDGSPLSTFTGRGGSPFHNRNAAENVAQAVRECLLLADLDAANAVGLAAGIAEIKSSPLDDSVNRWAAEFFKEIPASCPRSLVNDAVIAHRGALLGKAGVIVIAGTGSTALAITPDGREVENGWFEHYAGAARHLAFDAVQMVLIGAAREDDAGFVSDVLAYWGASDVDELRAIILGLRRTERTEIMPRYGRLAPTITAAAETSPLADRALRELARKTARSVQLLAPVVGDDPVQVALEGAVATHPSFRSRFADALAEEPSAVPVAIVPAALSPLHGAALLAYELAGIGWNDDLLAHLRRADLTDGSRGIDHRTAAVASISTSWSS